MRNLLALTLLFVSGALMAQTEKLNPAITATKWVKDLNIEFAYSQNDTIHFAPELKSGKNWFFEYMHKEAEYAERSDDEITEVIGFQTAPIKGSSFSLKNDQLTKAKAYFLLGCFCKDRGFKVIRNGSIQGKRINASVWKITFDVQIETGSGPIKRKYTANYHLKKN